jgi:hypothetical protein
MNSPSVTSVRVHNGGHGFEKSVHNGGHGFGKVPGKILTDPALTAVDIRVYGFLAFCERSGSATVGIRRIAKMIHAVPRKVQESLRRLVSAGYVAKNSRLTGKRTIYRLGKATSNEGGKQEVAGEVGQAEPRIMVRCPECGQRRGGLLKVGWCRSCNWGKKVRKIVREEIAEPSGKIQVA